VKIERLNELEEKSLVFGGKFLMWHVHLLKFNLNLSFHHESLKFFNGITMHRLHLDISYVTE
jgi:hypothetical protein